MGKKLNVDKLLAHLPLFEGMDAQVRARLAMSIHQIRIQKNEVVFRRGEPARGLFIVAAGYVKIAIPSDRTREKVIEFIGPGQAFGEAVMFLNHPYLVDVQALEDGLLLWIDKRDVEEAISHSPMFAMQMLKGLSERFETLLRDIEVVNLHTSYERVAGYLLRQPHEDELTPLLFNKRMIASKLGLTPETFSRALHQLSVDGLISVENAMVRIHDREGLGSLVAVATQFSQGSSVNHDRILPEMETRTHDAYDQAPERDAATAPHKNIAGGRSGRWSDHAMADCVDGGLYAI